jgi:hypothetical protein
MGKYDLIVALIGRSYHVALLRLPSPIISILGEMVNPAFTSAPDVY